MNRHYTGMIKSYNQGNGYGFIECLETFQVYQRDIFLHRTEFLQSGAEVGNTVVFQINVSDRGQPRAVNVQIMDGSGSGAGGVDSNNGNGIQNDMSNNQQAAPGSGGGMAQKRGRNNQNSNSDTLIGQRLFGQIRTFNQEKGFGFIQSEAASHMYGSPDIFLHYTQALNFRVGDFVTFELFLGEQGKPQARCLVKDGGPMGMPMGVPPPAVNNMNNRAAAANQAQQMAMMSNMQQMMNPMMNPMMMGNAMDFMAMSQQMNMGGNMGQNQMGGVGNMGGGQNNQNQVDPNKEYQGLIKSYNAEKGYGFIENTDVKAKFGRDVFLSRTMVDQFGLKVGENVNFTLKLDKGNPQAEIIGRSEEILQNANSKLNTLGTGPFVGFIKSYNTSKGFGFISCVETENAFGCDVFLHRSEIDDNAEAVGREVSFSIMLNQKGKPQAVEVQILENGNATGVSTNAGGESDDAAANGVEKELALDLEEVDGPDPGMKRRKVA